MGSILADGGIALGAAVAAAAVLIAALYLAWRRRRDPAERERRRRLQVNTNGRMTDGTIVDFQRQPGRDDAPGSHLIFYEYSVRGVDYATAQDVSAVAQVEKLDLEHCLGAVYVKYEARHPADSIVICEDWSGLQSASSPTAERVLTSSTESLR